MKRFLYIVMSVCVLYNSYTVAFADEPVYKDHTVIVASGETLWDIADRYTENKEDVREVVFRIAQANNMKSKHIYPGQVLKVPLRQQDAGFMLAQK